MLRSRACESMLRILQLPLRFLKPRRSVDTDWNMFNRLKEMDTLYQVLTSSPKLSVITGPINSGKSKLVDHVVTNLRNKKKVPVHTINLRQGTFNTVESLVDSLSSEKMRTWLGTVKNAIDAVSISVVKVNFTHGTSTPRRTPIERLHILLSKIAEELPQNSGKEHPIIFFDEANRLRSLLCDADGQVALESLFQFLVMHTKEKRRFHVIMATSDSFFTLWIEKFIGSSRYNTYVLGHLDEADAQKYWKEKVLVDNNYLFEKYDFTPPAFENAFEVCRGSMFLLNLFCEEYCQERGGGLIGKSPLNFSMVLQEKRKLVAAFQPLKTLPENEPPKWTKDQLMQLMRMLVESEGFVEYMKACEKVGKEVVHSMIEYNLLHLRTSSRLAYDVPEHTEPILTAESPCALMAMKLLLKK